MSTQPAPTPQSRHALIFGASGISGWALLQNLRDYPTPDTFARITACSNRPLSLADCLLPHADPDPRVQLVSGLDLTQPQATIQQLLTQKIPSIASVTHVFFTAYIAAPTFSSLRAANVPLVRNAVAAVAALAPALAAVVLQTGGKAYGVEFTAALGALPVPLKESLPRVPSPHGDDIFYYAQVDAVAALAAASSSSWTFTEARPDVIVGFVPADNAMDCARGLALYLTLWRRAHGEHALCPFPGTAASYACRHTDTSQDVLARFEIYAALHQERCGSKAGEAFNVADGHVTTWERKWGPLCAYFGLRAAPPEDGADGSKLLEFAEAHRAEWKEVVRLHGLKMDAAEKYDFNFLYFVMVAFDFDRQYDLSKSRSVGFDQDVETVRGYTIAFDRLKLAGIIPT